LRQLFGLLLCLLLCGFAIAAKTALFSPRQAQVKTLTSTKVWENGAVPAAAQTSIIADGLSLFAVGPAPLLLKNKLSEAEYRVDATSETPVDPISLWFTPYLAVRPPPAG
jgi:hypothetical protein